MASSTHSSVNNSDMRRSQMLHIASQLEHVSEVEASLRDFIPLLFSVHLPIGNNLSRKCNYINEWK